MHEIFLNYDLSNVKKAICIFLSSVFNNLIVVWYLIWKKWPLRKLNNKLTNKKNVNNKEIYMLSQ